MLAYLPEILDCAHPISIETWDTLINRWSFDLFSRKPATAVDPSSTDLDMVSLLSALVDRQAMVQLPTYTPRRDVNPGPKPAQVCIAKTNRRGKIINLVSNAHAWSFCIRLDDATVLRPSHDGGHLGAPRNFMVLDVDGTWHAGWAGLTFEASLKEMFFLRQYGIVNDADISMFPNFIHPNRWTSFYGADYAITKLAITRAEREARHCRAEMKRLSMFRPEHEYRGPLSMNGNPDMTEEPRPTKDITITTLEAQVDVDGWHGDFQENADSEAGFVEASSREYDLQYRVLPRLRFATRATEYAFFRHVTEHGMESLPHWIKRRGLTWETGVRLLRGRTAWNRMPFAHVAPGLALRYRTLERQERVTDYGDETSPLAMTVKATLASVSA